MRRALSLAVCCWATSALGVAAQEPARNSGFGIRAGISPYDLEDSGTAFVVAAHGYAMSGRHLLVELAFPILFRVYESFGGDLVHIERTRIMLPEVSAQLQGHAGNFRPYVALGAGWALRMSGVVDQGGTLHAAVGTRMLVERNMLARFEVRARAIRPWEGRTLDLTFGVEWLFP